MKIAIVLGTRPEIVKFSPVIKLLKARQRKFFVIHTGQHYSSNMTDVFFKELDLPNPKYNLDIGSGTGAEQIGKSLIKLEKIFANEKPDIVLVQGDTNSSLAGALTASKMNIKLGHIEAGLRSRDPVMPEEKNRIMIDHISQYLFAPTKESYANLVYENVEKNKIFITGNTIADVIQENLKKAKKFGSISKFDLKRKEYILITLHRQENVDSKKKLEDLCRAIELINIKLNYKLVWPIHPRTKKMLEQYKILTNKRIKTIPPQGFFDFLSLESNAALVITDSGGVQEEACILGVPCITVRDNTERPETINVGSNTLAGSKPGIKLVRLTKTGILNKKKWKHPFGKNVSQKIIKVIDIGGLNTK